MKKNITNQKGFSLIELLVVVIIIAIVAAIAIPNLLASRRAANEASAISSLRTIHSANATYFGTTGLNAAYSPDLATLGTQALIDTTLAAGGKSGFTFGYGVLAAQYCASATPNTTGTTGTGNRWFGVSATGVIIGGIAPAAVVCTAGTGILTGTGTPLQ